jgi:hypothetical protein
VTTSFRIIYSERPTVASVPQKPLGYGLRAALVELVKAMAEAEARRIVDGVK